MKIYDLNTFQRAIRIIAYNAIFFLFLCPLIHSCFYLEETRTHNIWLIICTVSDPYVVMGFGFICLSLLVMFLPLCLKWRICLLAGVELCLVSLQGVVIANICWMYYPVLISLLATFLACRSSWESGSGVKMSLHKEELGTNLWAGIIFCVSVVIAMLQLVGGNYVAYEFFYNIFPFYAVQIIAIFFAIGGCLLVRDSLDYVARYSIFWRSLSRVIFILCSSVVMYYAVDSIVEFWESPKYSNLLGIVLLPMSGALSIFLATLYYSFSEEKRRRFLPLSRTNENVHTIFPLQFIYSVIIFIVLWMIGNYLILHTFDLRQNEVESIEGTIERIRLWFIYCVPWQIMNLLEFLSYFMIYKMIKFSMCSDFLCKNTKKLLGEKIIMSIFVLSVIFSLYAKGEILFLKEKEKFMIQNMDLSMLSGQAVLLGVLMNALLIVYLARAKMIKPCVMGLLVMVCALPLMNFIQIHYFVNLWRNDTIVSYVWIFIMIVYMAFLLLGNNFLRKSTASTENGEQVQ